jgi:hypothetical protein
MLTLNSFPNPTLVKDFKAISDLKHKTDVVLDSSLIKREYKANALCEQLKVPLQTKSSNFDDYSV